MSPWLPFLALALGGVPIALFMRQKPAHLFSCSAPMRISRGFPRSSTAAGAGTSAPESPRLLGEAARGRGRQEGGVDDEAATCAFAVLSPGSGAPHGGAAISGFCEPGEPPRSLRLGRQAARGCFSTDLRDVGRQAAATAAGWRCGAGVGAPEA
jgi:hypothetical protein